MARNLSVGCTGTDVKELQLKLNNRMPPWSSQLNPDGVFGAKTEAAVKEYQALHNIEMAGVVGPATRGALATRVLLMQGDLYREIPLEIGTGPRADPPSRATLRRLKPGTFAQSQPAAPPPPPGSTVVQLQPNLTLNLPPWIFPPGQRPGTTLVRALQLSVVHKSSDNVGHVEAGAFVQVSSNSQSSPEDPRVSFTGGWQFVAADLLAPWKLPLLGWKLHPVSLVFQSTLVFNARPGSVVLGTSIGEQVQLDLGSSRFAVVISGSIGASADLTRATATLGPQGMVGGVFEF
jgi:hypothetical protein